MSERMAWQLGLSRSRTAAGPDDFEYWNLALLHFWDARGFAARGLGWHHGV